MDSYDDIFDQICQFSPLCLSPPQQPFTSTMESLQDLAIEETERVDEETVALVSNPAINEVSPSPITQSPDLFPFPETLTVLQSPLEWEQQQLLCNPHEHLQGNLPNEHLDQPSLLNQSALNAFQGPSDFTMIDFDQLMEEVDSVNAHPTVTQSFELPNHLQEQFPSVPSSQSFPSYPTYQHAPVASHSNMYNQQPPPLVLANRENEPIAPRMVTDLARSQNYSSYATYPHGPIPSQFNMYEPPLVLTNREDAPDLIPRMATDLPRTYPLQNQISMTQPQPQVPPSSSTSPNFHRNQGNVEELVNPPSPPFSYPTLHTYAQMDPGTNLFSPLQDSMLVNIEVRYPKHVEYGGSSSSSRRRSSVLGRRQRNDQNQFEHGESSSSSAQRRRMVSPKRNDDSTAAPERLINKLYDPKYESLRLYIDPHLRKFNLM